MNKYLEECTCKDKWRDYDKVCFVCAGTGYTVKDDYDDLVELIEVSVSQFNYKVKNLY